MLYDACWLYYKTKSSSIVIRLQYLYLTDIVKYVTGILKTEKKNFKNKTAHMQHSYIISFI